MKFLFSFLILSFPFLAFTQDLDQNDPSITPQDHEVNPYFDQENHVQVAREHESDTFQAKFLNMLFILGLLIAFMILASWALKRMMKSKITQLNTASHIKILETRQISPKTTLHLIEVQDKAFLIAESPSSTTYLSTLSLVEEYPSSHP